MELDEIPKEQSKKGRKRIHGRFIAACATVLILAGLMAGGYFGYKAWRNSQIIIPASIKSKVNFVIFWPGKSASVKNDKKTIKYDSSKKVLSYVSRTTAGGIQLSIGEQATPDVFNDVPQVYTQLIDSSKEYASFGSLNGEVYLTHPADLNGGQSAIMNAKGTLMFIHPINGQLTEDQWKKLFNNLQTIQ